MKIIMLILVLGSALLFLSNAGNHDSLSEREKCEIDKMNILKSSHAHIDTTIQYSRDVTGDGKEDKILLKIHKISTGALAKILCVIGNRKVQVNSVRFDDDYFATELSNEHFERLYNSLKPYSTLYYVLAYGVDFLKLSDEMNYYGHSEEYFRDIAKEQIGLLTKDDNRTESEFDAYWKYIKQFKGELIVTSDGIDSEAFIWYAPMNKFVLFYKP